MRFGIWSLLTVASELVKYKLDIAAVQVVRWLWVVVSQQTFTHLCMDMGMLIIT
jgi:hypothetical protein